MGRFDQSRAGSRRHLNVEPYYNLAYLGTPTLQLESTLRELALFDHLFSLRQWRLEFAAPFIDWFFDQSYDGAFAVLGWSKNDVIALVRGLMHFATRDPNLITISALKQSGIDGRLLDSMLPYFAFDYSTVNAGYLTPLSADKADLMFKPVIRHGPGHILLPSKGLLGPAMFEATMAAVRPHMPRGALSKLMGSGTERVAQLLFARSGIEASYASAKYKVGSADEGECDLVYETDEVILLVECKAKPLTRGAMAGISGDALLDFGGGMFSAQKQALAHERVLRSEGHITFEDGRTLSWNSRRIVRLSITLLDHGALQDRMMLFHLYGALHRAELRADPSYGKSKQVGEFNKSLEDLRSEVLKLEAAGVEASAQPINFASVSVGQLDVLLDGIDSLDAFLKRAARPVTFSTLSPLAELHYLRTQNMTA